MRPVRTHQLVLACAILAANTACYRAITIAPHATGANPPKYRGIPFYPKIGEWKRSSTYAHTWFDVTLKLGRKDAEGKVVEVPPVLRASVGHRGAAALKGRLAEGMPGTTAASELAKHAKERADGPTSPETCRMPDCTLISNAIDLVSRVDYTRPLEINVKQPFIGSSKLAAKLAPDGSLTEVAAESENKTGEVIAGLIPGTELLSAAFKLGGVETAAAADEHPKPPGHDLVVLSMELAQRGYLYTFVDATSADQARPTSALPFNLEACAFTRTELGSEDKGDGKSKVGFSGSVSLPESK